MKKSTLRSLGIGFLSAAILTGAYAVFVQGHMPVGGVQVNSLLSNTADEELAQYEEEMSSLIIERDSLESTRNTLNESIANYRDNEEEMSREISSLAAANSSLRGQADGSPEDETAEEPETETDEDTETTTDPDTETATQGEFTISEGESSEEISLRLEEAGFIDSSDEFLSLLEEWNLNAVIQTGNFELDDSMTIHDIATIITDGAYFYY